MPNRFIRESCRTSATLDQLSDGAERMFWRLTTVADDFGRFEADPRILLSNCFPLRVDRTKTSKIEGWFLEMMTTKNPDGELDPLIISYFVNGKRYGFFSTWSKYQTCRAATSKHPDPTPENICKQPHANVPVFVFDNRIRISNSSNGAGALGFDGFWKSYPKKRSKGQAEKAWNKLSPDEQLQGQILASLERAKTSEGWAKDQGRFIPHPATWLNAKGWEDEYSATQNTKTWLEKMEEKERLKNEQKSI